MGLMQDFDLKLKDSLKRRDARETAVLRMIKSKFQLKMAEKGDPTLSDEVVLEQVSAYVKQLKKALPEFEKGGERARDRVEQLQYEIGYLEQYLPKILSEAETRALVAAKKAELGVTDPRQIGRLMGALMKDYKGKVDPELVKRVATELLGGTA